MKAYILERLLEPSTWRGLVLILTSLGVSLSAEQAQTLIAAGMALAGLIGVVAKK